MNYGIRFFGLLTALGSNLLVGTAMAALAVNGAGESFEGGTTNYSLTGEFGGPTGKVDFFQVIPNDGSRVEASTITTGGVFNGGHGSNVLASEDSNALGTNPVSVQFIPANTLGFADLSLSLLLAATDETNHASGGSHRGIELLDRVEIEIDTGGGFSQLAIFQPAGGGTNTYLSLNGTAAGSGTGATDIEQGFKEFSFPFADTSSATFRINIQGDATGEYIAIDNVRVLGTVVPEPTSVALLAIAAIWVRRFRKRSPV